MLANAEDFETIPGPSIDMFSQSGDISSIYLCGACKEPVTWNDKGIMCESCESWFHIQCQNVPDTDYEQLGQFSVAWICQMLPVNCHGGCILFSCANELEIFYQLDALIGLACSC